MNISALSGEVEFVVSSFKAARVLPFAVMAIALCGCGAETGSRSMMAATQPAAGYLVEDVAGGGGDGTQPATGNQGGTIVTAPVTAAGGGVLICGRFTLTLPAGALKSDAQITMMDLTAARGYPCVQIMTADVHFKSSATLVSEVSDLQDPAMSTVYWLHALPHNRVVWSSVGGSVTPGGTAVSASIGRGGTFAITSTS